MWSLLIVLDEPGVEIGLQLIDPADRGVKSDAPAPTARCRNLHIAKQTIDSRRAQVLRAVKKKHGK